MTGSDATVRLVDLGVVVDDLARAETLYGDVLGGAVVDGGAGRFRAEFPPGVALEVLDLDAFAATGLPASLGEGTGLRWASFATDGGDVDRAVKDLASRGYEVVAADGHADHGAVTLRPPPGLGGVLRICSDDGRGHGDGAVVGRVRHLDHVCCVSASARRAVDVFAGALGGAVVFGGDNPHLGTRSAQVKMRNGVKVEILEPRAPHAVVGLFLERHPLRFHHVTVLTDDVAECIAALDAHGFGVVDTDLTSRETWRETFVRPSHAWGALIQIVDTPLTYADPLPADVVEGILTGAYDSRSYTMTPSDRHEQEG